VISHSFGYCLEIIIGAGSVLIKNPEPYEIWAGIPAKEIANRKEMDMEQIRQIADRKKFWLTEHQRELGQGKK